MQEPLSDKEIEELIAEFLEVESKVSMFSVLFLTVFQLCTQIYVYSFYGHAA